MHDMHDDDPTLPVHYHAIWYCNDGFLTSSESALLKMQAIFLLIDIAKDFEDGVIKCG